MNNVILMGRLVKAPDVKYTQSGNALLGFTLAVDGYRNRDGNKKTDYINCQAWNKLAELMSNYSFKGQKILVQGKIQTRNYEGHDGIKKYITEIVAESVEFLEWKKDERQKNTATTDMSDFGQDMLHIDEDEEVPF